MVTVKKFSAVWCGPCRALAPVINEIKSQFSNVADKAPLLAIAPPESSAFPLLKIIFLKEL